MSYDEINCLYDRMKSYMVSTSAYLDEDYTREDMAKALNTNRTYLTEALRFKHLTFYRFVNSYRAQYAIELLTRKPTSSVEDIAFLSGFRTARAMNRYIKQSAGLSARALRNRITGD